MLQNQGWHHTPERDVLGLGVGGAAGPLQGVKERCHDEREDVERVWKPT
jgi:hypothetical protein